MNKDLEQAKALLENNEEYTCAACRAGESFASEEHGVRPLMRWLNGNCRWKTSPAEKRTCRLLPSSRLWKIKSRWGQCFDGWFPNRA